MLGPIFIKLLFPKYILSLTYFYPLLLYIPITALATVASVFLVVMRMQRYLFFQKVIKTITVLPLLLLIWLYGLWGLVLYQVVFALLLFLSVYRFLRNVPPGFSIKWRELLTFGAEDKAFLERFLGEVGRFIRGKLSFFFQ